MTDGKLTVIVGGSLEDDAAAFIDAWKRAEQGESFEERQLAFESWHTLMRVLTPKRYDLLRHVHRHPAASVAALARDLDRDYRRVHEDVKILAETGLLDRDGRGIHADYDEISTRIAI